MICAGVNQPVLLDVGDERLVIDFVERRVRRPLLDENPRYQFVIARELVDHLVREHVEDWVNELFLSMRFGAHRRGPYNDYVYTWFKCLNVERLQYAEGFYAEHGPTQGTFELAGYDVQRRCPHMKADLTRFATVEDGVMTCALHGWQWEMATGTCITSEGHPLYARPIGRATRRGPTSPRPNRARPRPRLSRRARPAALALQQPLDQLLGGHVRPAAAHHQDDVARLDGARQVDRGRLGAAGRDGRDAAPRARRVRERRGRRDRRVRVADGPDVDDGRAIGLGEHLREPVEHGRGPVVGQRLVDRPQAAARVALARGRERHAHRGRVVRVVVEHGHPADLALELEPPPHALERRRAPPGSRPAPTPAARAPPAAIRASMAMCRPMSPMRTRSGAASGPRRPTISRSCRRGPRPRPGPRAWRRRAAWPGPRRRPRGGRGSVVRTSRRAPRARDGRPVSPTFATRVAGPSGPGVEPPDPVGEGPHDGILGRRRRRGGPTRPR